MQQAAYIVYGGDILTMAEPAVVEAVAVCGDHVLACGALEEMRTLAGPATRMVHLDGRCLLPGFIDAHSHFIDTSLRTLRVDLRSRPIGRVERMDDLIALLADRAAVTRPGDWVTGWGYDDTKLREMRHPTRADLDRASLDHPIVIQHLSGWVTAANSRALAMAGIGRNTRDTDGVVIRRGADGTPDGVIQAATCPVWSMVPAPSGDEAVRSLAAGAGMYLAKGCTTAQEGWTADPAWIALARDALERGLPGPRLVIYPYGQDLPLDEYEARFPRLASGRTLDDGGHLVMGADKLACDGSIQAYTGWLTQPYHVCPEGRPGWKGHPSSDPRAMKERIMALHARGRQLAVHANGDAAIDAVLDALAAAQAACPRGDCRHILIHSQMARADQIERMAALGVVPSFFIAHVYYWGERHMERFMGPERARRMSPCGDALRAGLPFTLHNDTYVTPIDPLLLVWAAVNRRTDQGRDLGREEQGVPVMEALKAVTVNAARQDFEEERKGSIAAGRLADFVVLEENPCTVDPMRIKDIAVTATVVGGRLAWGALD